MLLFIFFTETRKGLTFLCPLARNESIIYLMFFVYCKNAIIYMIAKTTKESDQSSSFKQEVKSYGQIRNR